MVLGDSNAVLGLLVFAVGGLWVMVVCGIYVFCCVAC